MKSPLVTLDVTARAAAAHHGFRAGAPWGLCIHTTGSGVPTDAKAEGRPAMEVALDIYCKGPNAAHYVIDHAGVLACVAPENVVTWHAGRFGPPPEKIDRRPQYLSGEWRAICSPAAVAAWDRQWFPKYKSPQHLYPGESANAAYVGVEMIPIAKGQGVPTPGGGLYTEAQYVALVALGEDLARRHSWPRDWAATPRLLGHEDVGILDRHTEEGCWDPGFLRDEPHFDFPRVRMALSPP